ncbi:hypothetical protein UFOVP826_66 [uncultured Caudovirales phage]|uniref:Uncharacterized protein n=1 Tax=uncultured Caudovirales phage TaxID=2100421 RepID=A0A6J5P016_9CAUD|nr:hypothetical protein UFOVP826_66 [uncultured Caudovirales phage]
MAGVRGRPRRVALTEGQTIAETMEPLPSIVDDTEQERQSVINPTDYTRPVIINPRHVKPTPERMGVVLEKMAKFLERGFEITPDRDGVSITIRKGQCAESINITSSDVELQRAVNRVAVWAATARAAVQS